MQMGNVVNFKPNVSKDFLDELARLASFCRHDMNQVSAMAAILHGVLRNKVVNKQIGLI